MDEQFEALANTHRRRLLVALFDHNPQRESVVVPDDVHDQNKPADALQMEFHHLHLPKLEEAGFIIWNLDTHEVAKGPRFDAIMPLLKLLRKHSDELPDDWL